MKTYILIILIAVLGIGGLYWAGTVLLTENLEAVDVALESPDLFAAGRSGLLGQPAPEFELPIVSGGQRPDLVLDSGKPTVLVFWASWHHGSVDQLKILDDFIKDRVSSVGDPILDGLQDPIFIAVALQEDKNKVADFVRANGYENLNVFADETGEVGELYNVRTLPTIFFIDGQGVIQDIFVGVLNKDMLEEKIQKLIAK